MRALIGSAVVAIAACSAPSEIVKTGPTTYRVRTDAGGGKYTATLSSSTSPGTATITGTINSQPIAASTTVVFT